MDTLLTALVIVFCIVGAVFLFSLSYKCESDDEVETQERLHPKEK
jgi:hypothetical protein